MPIFMHKKIYLGGMAFAVPPKYIIEPQKGLYNMPKHVIQSFYYVSMYIVGGNHRSNIASHFSMYHTYIVGGNHRSNIASRFSMYHTYIVGGNHRSRIASRFSIYRSNKILLLIIFVNRENGILRDFLKIFW